MKKKSKWLDGMTLPVDPKTFVFMSGVYQAAAGMTMPVANPEAGPIFEGPGGKGYVLKDIPINRGMLAVNAELRKMNIKPAQAYTARLMHMYEIFEAQEKFAEFFKPSDEDGSVMVSEALLMACGVARLVIGKDHFGFDLDDVLHHARRFDAEDQDQK